MIVVCQLAGKKLGAPMKMVPVPSGWLLAILLAMLGACGGDPDNPEQQIRHMLATAEQAVEDRSITGVVNFVANNYKDQSGRQKREINQLIAGYILRNKGIHLLTRVHQVNLNQDGTRADIILYVGMAGVPLAGADQLVMTRADLYRFDLSLVQEEGEWRVAAGKWHPARAEDF